MWENATSYLFFMLLCCAKKKKTYRLLVFWNVFLSLSEVMAVF